MTHRTRILSVLAGASLAASGLAALPSQAAGHELTNGCIQSVPDLDDPLETPVDICWSLYRPATASAESPVPVIFHSHGWGGSRTSSATAFTNYLDAGFGVLSFDQRGFGQSGGHAHVENIDVEGHDVLGLVDLLAGLDWVEEEAPGDPVLGAIGGSYGGGYQMVGAFAGLKHRGVNYFDALAPEITWYDLQESLAPEKVARTAWITALYAAGADAHTATVHQSFAYGAATGDWPEGPAPLPSSTEFFRNTGPKGHLAAGVPALDIPVLLGQGLTDNLFNLNQGLKNWQHALTDGARARSVFVGYNGGHALPNVLPAGAGGSADPCSAALQGGSGSFGALALRFFQTELLGAADSLAPARGDLHLATVGNECLTIDGDAPHAVHLYELDPITRPIGAGTPSHLPLATAGPEGMTIGGGIPTVSAEVWTTSTEGRAFFALSIGTSPADATVIQNNVMPLRVPGPTLAPVPMTIELPAVAAELAPGETLFLTVSPVSDMFFGHGSRVAGTLTLDDLVVAVPEIPAAT